MQLFHTIDSPIGELLLTGDRHALTGVRMAPFEINPWWRRNPAVFGDAQAQLRAYFAGELRRFDVPLELAGTEFQVAAWQALADIPYGTTISYGEQARRIGRPRAVRAVGAANGRNPLPIVLPCHRLLGADGSLVGFGGGLARKRLLIEHEARFAARR